MTAPLVCQAEAARHASRRRRGGGSRIWALTAAEWREKILSGQPRAAYNAAVAGFRTQLLAELGVGDLQLRGTGLTMPMTETEWENDPR